MRTVTKTETDDINWYDYNESKWANAVILTATDNYRIGDPIPEEAIESYFVWIPKYRYKLFNVEGNSIPEQEIKIEIGDYDTVNSDTECVATNKSGDNGTCKNDMWMTHPAFTSLGVNGIWVGKFETGYKGSTDKSSAEKNENAPEKVQIKPNVNSWRSISISNIYYTSFNYKRYLDSHMMKNTEWGAMAYFTNSKFGRRNSEVIANLDNNYLTGCTNTTTYFNNSAGASTTNNIYGVYDLVGGAFEEVMGVYNYSTGSSGFGKTDLETINKKYIDNYTGTVGNSYKILGDAIGETRSWFPADVWFPGANSNYVWFSRDNDKWGNHAGIYAFNWSNGIEASHHTFRIVLSPTN